MRIEQVKKLSAMDRYLYWVQERESIRVKKEAGEPKPWTDDIILQTYRFCNVRREDDKVTRWIAKNWRNPNKRNPDLWFAMAVARLFNLPSTLAAIGFPVPWNPTNVGPILTRLRESKSKVFNGAYIVSTNGRAMGKIEYLIEHVLRELWSARKTIQPVKGESLSLFHTRLTQQDGLGSFMAAQIVADVKYAPSMAKATDWHTFAASGPGSKRGLNRVLSRHPNESWGGEEKWRNEITKLQTYVNSSLDWPTLIHAQDIQSCCCEFDKYERILCGEGTPKQRYRGV